MLDRLIAAIHDVGYHNHRGALHSKLLSQLMVEALSGSSYSIREDLQSGEVTFKYDYHLEGRKIDLVLLTTDTLQPRLAVEHKSILSSHGKNTGNRIQDIGTIYSRLQGMQAYKPVIAIATFLIGFCDRYLNVCDRVKSACRARGLNFEQDCLPRLSTGDQSLWDDFDGCHEGKESRDSGSGKDPIHQSVYDLRTKLPVRNRRYTSEEGLDYLLLIPVLINNVDPPRLHESRDLDLYPKRDFQEMIDLICDAYDRRWK